MKAIEELDAAWDKSDVEMNERYPNYHPKTLEDLQNESKLKYSVAVDLGDEKNNIEKSPKIEDNSSLVKDKGTSIS
jgi:hypothetical protein